ncbi:hypothetical protein Tco_0546732 [Tanacetum coccineum]
MRNGEDFSYIECMLPLAYELMAVKKTSFPEMECGGSIVVSIHDVVKGKSEKIRDTSRMVASVSILEEPIQVANALSRTACDLKVDWNMFDEISKKKVMAILLQETIAKAIEEKISTPSSESNMTCVILLQELGLETDDKTELAGNIRVFASAIKKCVPLCDGKRACFVQADDGSFMEEPGSGTGEGLNNSSLLLQSLPQQNQPAQGQTSHVELQKHAVPQTQPVTTPVAVTSKAESTSARPNVIRGIASARSTTNSVRYMLPHEPQVSLVPKAFTNYKLRLVF